MKILIVDDNAENLYLLSALLKGHGSEVVEARHGAEALVKARQARPDLIISDLLMPVMDGYTLLRQWKSDDRLEQVPFVVYTATYTEPKDEQLALDLGADAFIIKPSDPEAFMVRIDEVMAKAKGGDFFPPESPDREEEILLKEYSEILVRKLEHKALKLEQANRNLAMREARYRAIFETEPECVKLVSPDSALIEMNAAGLRMIEADSLDQVIGQSVLALILPEHQTAFAELIKKAVKGDQGTLEFEIKGLKGTRRWLQTHAAPLRDEDKNVCAILGITRDITEQRLAEAASKESADRLRLAVKASNVGLWDWNLQTNQAVFSREWKNQLGYEEHEIVDDFKEWEKRVHPEDLAATADRIQKYLANPNGAHEVEFRMRHKDGSWRWIYARAEIFADETGQPVRMLGCHVDITNRKQAEADLKQSEEMLRKVMDGLGPTNFVGLLSPEGTLLSVNRPALEAAGLRLEEVLGKPVDQTPWFNHSEAAQEQLRAAIARAAAGEPSRYDVQVCVAGDALIWLDFSIHPVRDTGGRVIHLVPSATVIDERKQAEKHIRQLNRTYSVLSDINQLIVRERDIKVLLYEACRIAFEKGDFHMAWIGLREETSSQTKIVAHAGVAPDTLQKLNSIANGREPENRCVLTDQAFETRRHAVCNNMVDDPDSAPWPELELDPSCLAMASLPLMSGEKPIGTFNLYAVEVGFFDDDEMRLLDELASDISFGLEVSRRETERKLAERQQRESEALYRTLFDYAPDGIVIADPNGRYVDANASACRMLGYERVELIKLHSTDIIAESEVKHVGPDLRESTGDSHHEKEWRFLRKNGSTFSAEVIATQMPDGNILGLIRDITGRRLLENQLRQSQKMEAIGQLAGGVAHDFNNILAAIMAQADLAITGPILPVETRELLNDIKASTERAANLTRQLLAFGRRQVMQPRDVDLNEVVTNLTRMLQRILGEDVSLQINLNPQVLITHADAGMLDQVLMNLVVNARDAMPEGGELRIETYERNLGKEEAASIIDGTPGSHVCLCVSDTGGGIASEHLSHLFEPFFTTKEAGKGTGLGLSTVYGIIKQHGGSIAVDSQAGKGTTFRIFFPSSKATSNSPAPTTAKPDSSGGTETILMVEDDPSLRRLTRAVLERKGYMILEASNGTEARSLWDQHHETIDLLFTDIVMPGGVNGHELAIRLREQKPTLRVVFTSGYSAEIAGRELVLEEGQNFVQKPATPQELTETVRRCLDT